MKKQLSSILFVICLVTNFNGISYANEDTQDIEPNVYEKQEIHIKQSGENNLIERRKLPEEQKELTFDKDKETESEQLIDELFESTIIETNTITSKADKMELFSATDEELKREMEEELVSEGSNLLKILMIIAVTVIIGLLFIIVPKIQRTQE